MRTCGIHLGLMNHLPFDRIMPLWSETPQILAQGLEQEQAHKKLLKTLDYLPPSMRQALIKVLLPNSTIEDKNES